MNSPRPLLLDSPDVLTQLQRYAVATEEPDREAESNLPPAKPVQSYSCGGSSFGSGNVSRHDAAVTNVIQPNMDATAAQDLRTSSKRKASTPSLDERPSKQSSAGKHFAASMGSQGFPFPGGYSLPMGLNPAMLGGALGHPLFFGAGSPYFHPSHSPLGDPGFMHPDLFGLGAVPSSSSSSALTTSTATAVSSSSSSSESVKAASSVPGALPPFMLNPSMAGMAGMLPPGFPLTYSQSLAGLYTGSMLPGGLPGPAATPGPAGASFLSQYPSTAASSSSSSSPSSYSPSARSEGHRVSVLVNGVNSASSSDDEDDDVIEVGGK